MSTREAFAPEDWPRIVSAPLLATLAVTASDPHGIVSALQESAASARSLYAARSNPDPLVHAIVETIETHDGRVDARKAIRALTDGKAPAAMVDATLAELGALSALVESKAPASAPAFRTWIKEIATAVAEAGSEGGFLGFGGPKVSDAEKATIARLAAALG